METLSGDIALARNGSLTHAQTYTRIHLHAHAHTHTHPHIDKAFGEGRSDNGLAIPFNDRTGGGGGGGGDDTLVIDCS